MVGRLRAWRQQREEEQAARLGLSNGVTFCFAGPPQELEQRAGLILSQGTPRYENGSLVSDADSYAVYLLRDPASTDRGEIAFTFTPAWESPRPRDGVNQRAYLHLADRPFTCSCVSIISFYTGLHVRFYDAERHYIEVLETDIQHWEKGRPTDIRVAWDAEAGEAILWLDGEERDGRPLGRRLAGAFKQLHLGHRPGNWRAQGKIGALQLKLG
jgi:hypothetical protein